MYFLNACENPDILRIVYFLLKIMDLIFLVVPIILVVYITIDIIKIIIGANNDKTLKDKHKSIINRIIFALFLFFVPTIVTVVMNVLSVAGVSTDYQSCIDNANKESINFYQQIKDEEEKLKSETNNHTNKNNTTNNAASGTTYQKLAKEMVNLASKEVGTKEGSNSSNKYGKELGLNNQPWCAIFVTWVAKNTNADGINLYNDVITKNSNISNFGSTTSNLLHFYNQKNLDFHYSKHYGGSYTPKAGDYIFFDWDNEWNKILKQSDVIKAAEHTGMVKEVKNGKVYTIEGNKDNQVKEASYDLNSKSIMGYGSWYN